MQQRMTIGQFGTFEVENYGDRLFPLITHKELSKRLVDWNFQPFSPLTSEKLGITPIITPEGQPFSDFSLPDAIVVGGGDIISFATQIAFQYHQEWKHLLSPHTACWALPAIYRKPRAPLVWNAPGVPCNFTKEQSRLVKLLADESDYISVRDEISLKRLLEAGITKEIFVVPDTALLLQRHYPKEQLNKLADKVFAPFKLSLGEPLVVQAHPYYIENHIEQFTAAIKEIKRALNTPLLLLPLGYCHNDHLVLEKIYEASQGEFHFIRDKLDTLTTAAVIAHAKCFIGTSLHGNITAFAYGIPFLIYSCAGLSKLEGFVQLAEEQERLCYRLDDLVSKRELLHQSPSKDSQNRICKQIETHFDRMSTILKQPSPYNEKMNDREIIQHYLTLAHQKDLLENDLKLMSQHMTAKDQQITHLKNCLHKPPLLQRLFRKMTSLLKR